MSASRELPAGEYWFEDCQPGGYFYTGHILVTEAQVVGFAGLSGDFFDVHMDDEFARAQGFPGRIAHGLLGLSLIDGLKNRAAVRLMAVASLGWSWQFRAPILMGDRIGAKIQVNAARISSKGQGIVTLGLVVTKQDGTTVQEGETTLLMRQRTASIARE